MAELTYIPTLETSVARPVGTTETRFRPTPAWALGHYRYFYRKSLG